MESTDNISNLQRPEVLFKTFLGVSALWDFVLSNYTPIVYLESNGSQYIDTIFVPDAHTGLDIVVTKTNSNDQYIIGIRDNNADTRWCIGQMSGTYFYYGYGSSGSNVVLGSGGKTEVKLNWLDDKKFGDGNTVQTLPSLYFTPSNKIRIFGTSGVVSQYTRWAGKLHSVKISQGSNVVFDAIPVRVGSVGYLYDKVSGKFFANQGTGDFVLGPDL